jgi:anti-sigma regulatory factor (Ser/Thr protein kinase)
VIAVTLTDGLSAPTTARRLVASVLGGAGCSPDIVERAVLVGSELVTNAVLHGHGAPRMRMSIRPGRTRLSVYDSGPGVPTAKASPGAPTLAQSGRGLMIVADQSDRWGVRPEQRGKWVWAEFRTAPWPRIARAAAQVATASLHAAAETLRPRPARRAARRRTFEPVRSTAPA